MGHPKYEIRYCGSRGVSPYQCSSVSICGFFLFVFFVTFVV
jgi:hypothetical protein